MLFFGSFEAKEACDLVLKQMPENTKARSAAAACSSSQLSRFSVAQALYRRAQAQMQQRDFVEVREPKVANLILHLS